MFSISSRRVRLFLVVLCGCALLGVVVGATYEYSRRHRQQSTSAGPRVDSKSSGLRVIDTKRVTVGNTSFVFLKLQNVSAKPIKALTISLGQSYVVKNFLLSEEAIAPGASVIERLSVPPSIQEGSSTGSQPTIVVTAVFYSDGTGDGDSQYVQLLKNQALGMRDQAKRILPTLRRASGGQSEQALADLESEGNALPIKAKVPVSPDYDEGLQKARKILLGQLGEIKEQRRMNDFQGALNKQNKMVRIFESLADGPNNQ